MTPLRQRMIEDLQLRGLSKITQGRYKRAVRQLAEYYDKSPGKITEEELGQDFLYLKNEKQYDRYLKVRMSAWRSAEALALVP